MNYALESSLISCVGSVRILVDTLQIVVHELATDKKHVRVVTNARPAVMEIHIVRSGIQDG